MSIEGAANFLEGLTPRDHRVLVRHAALAGFADVGEYIMSLHRTAVSGKPTPVDDGEYAPAVPFCSTAQGVAFQGDCRSWLFDIATPESVDLIMTSPPFGLVRKKAYGNESADAYCDWFRPFAEGFSRVLKDSGSLVIDIGGAWNPGLPTRSLYHFKLLIMLVEEYGFHLCQEHYWWNPAKLPSPVEWVNIRRVRVKDAVNCIWWLSKTPYPKANNGRVLQPYSKSMKKLLRDGTPGGDRPSGHKISKNFQKNNGGAIPPNLLAIANTESTGEYQKFCRDHGLPIHPARFPSQLPEYFIRMLTDPGDLVVDPFGGSCVTGAVAEASGRRWACCELSEEYLKGAVGRLRAVSSTRPKTASYEISTPCSVSVDEAVTATIKDGGRSK